MRSDLTDVDGVMTADPRLVPDARVIPVLSYGEVGEMAYWREVLARQDGPAADRARHSDSGQEHVQSHVPRHADHQSGKGVARNGQGCDRHPRREPGHRAGRGMIGVPGIAARTFSAVAAQKASVLMIRSRPASRASVSPSRKHQRPGGEGDPGGDGERAWPAAISSVWADDNIEIIAVVGAGMLTQSGVAARIRRVGRGQDQYSGDCPGCQRLLRVDDCGHRLSVEAVRQIHKLVVLNGGDQLQAPQAHSA